MGNGAPFFGVDFVGCFFFPVFYEVLDQKLERGRILFPGGRFGGFKGGCG